ncbi:hypothetical protein PYCCODRAFT_1464565 [Trametes coccinea BRFM310]|uniref:Uncharacterized protein n=1 Tax=Trametes coccinea (strain BRFM310) TaxID=1353009 RepID=A0A1Y2J2I5_TRAC3|nr:hypothetical protein PYCCODRAFT_1464565 [Trametes coccinea BRFM310]
MYASAFYHQHSCRQLVFGAIVYGFESATGIRLDGSSPSKYAVLRRSTNSSAYTPCATLSVANVLAKVNEPDSIGHKAGLSPPSGMSGQQIQCLNRAGVTFGRAGGNPSADAGSSRWAAALSDMNCSSAVVLPGFGHSRWPLCGVVPKRAMPQTVADFLVGVSESSA